MKEGETAYFDFELSHENMPVTWYKNDKKLHNSRTVHISEEGKNHKLEISEVTLDDISEIKAVVKNLHTQAHLKVLGNILCCLVWSGTISVYFNLYVFNCLWFYVFTVNN